MQAYLRKLTLFLNEKYPTLYSLLDLDIEKAEREWLFWLARARDFNTQENQKHDIWQIHTGK